MSDPTSDANGDPGDRGGPPSDGGPPRPPEPPGATLVGPAVGILIGFLVLRLLPAGTGFAVRLLIAVVVIAVVTYAATGFARWRGRR